MRYSTRGQMQLGEIIIIMIIFFFILGFGLVFFTQFVANQAHKERSTVNDLNLAETAKTIASLPELHCSQGGDESLYCIDLYKAQAFARTLADDPLHYANTFTGYRVEVRCIYPVCTEIPSFVLLDYTTPTAESDRPFVLPVLLYNPVAHQYAYGEIIIWQRT